MALANHAKLRKPAMRHVGSVDGNGDGGRNRHGIRGHLTSESEVVVNHFNMTRLCVLFVSSKRRKSPCVQKRWANIIIQTINGYPENREIWGIPDHEDGVFKMQCERLFKYIDADGDGTLSTTEIIQFCTTHIHDVTILADMMFRKFDSSHDGEEANGELDQAEFREIILDLCKGFSYGKESSIKKDSFKRADVIFAKFSEKTRDPKKENDVRRREDKAISKAKFAELLEKERWILNFWVHKQRKDAEKPICRLCGFDMNWVPSKWVEENGMFHSCRKRGEDEGESVDGCSVL